jgi:hypothetical protein
MNNPYDLTSWSKQYREERLTEASRRYLTERARVSREPHSGWGCVSLAWASMFSLLFGAGSMSSPSQRGKEEK